MTRPLAILGDSHVPALLTGVKRAAPGLLVGGGWGGAKYYHRPFFTVEQGRVTPDPAKVHYDMWLRATGGRGIQDFPRGLIVSMGLSASHFYSSSTWRHYGPGKAPISEALVETMIADMQDEVVRFYEALIAEDLLLAIYLPPPPQREHPVYRYMPVEQVAALTRRFTRPVTELIERRRVPTIALDLADDEGFLRDEYRGKDTAHAGPSIGPAAARAIEALLAGG